MLRVFPHRPAERHPLLFSMTRPPLLAIALWSALLIASALALRMPVCDADELDEFEATEVTEEAAEEPSDLPIAVELAQGIELLHDQIAKQQELLKTAKSEREQELIRNHLRLLQKERRSLESLLHKLVGPNYDIREAAKEQQTESRAERQEKTLEQDERFTEP